VLMALIRQTGLFLVVAALAGVGWTLSASELWVAAQRAMPNWPRGRMNASVIMFSQGAMALGGVIWGSAAATAGTSYTLLEGLESTHRHYAAGRTGLPICERSAQRTEKARSL
jgi:hypothetical protein